MAAVESAWPSKVGQPGQPGYSPFEAPSPCDGGCAPRCVLMGGDMAPLVDMEGNIYVNSRGQVGKANRELDWLWKMAPDEGDGFAGVGVLAGGAFLLYTAKGLAISCDQHTGKERWRRKFCGGGCTMDHGAAAAGSGVLVVAGKKDAASESMAFSDTIYGLDLKNGQEKWNIGVQFMLLCCVPSIVEGQVFFQSASGHVQCHSAATGKQAWASPPAGQISTGGAVADARLGLVFSTANLRSKKAWNAPFGGKGCVRCLALKTGEVKWKRDFELEANALPAVVPNGPNGKTLVVAGLGANPGTWKNPTGDTWPCCVVALDAADGEQVWRADLPTHFGHGIGGSEPNKPGKDDQQGVCWSNPVATASGKIYISWHLLRCLEVNALTAEVKIAADANPTFQAGAAVGPGMLVLTSNMWMFVYSQEPIRARILRELAVPFSESGCEHFWPTKQLNLSHTELAKVPASGDLTKRAWTSGDITRHPYRLAGWDWWHKTPIVDAQRNIYLATNNSKLLVVRPDGNLRGYVDCGSVLSNPCLHKEHLYVANGAGFCLKVDVETLEIVWSKKYCGYTPTDSWNPIVSERFGIILLVGTAVDFNPGDVGGAREVYGLRIGDGSKVFSLPLRWITYNFLPSMWEDEDLFVFADNSGGMYGARISTGELVWEHTAESEDNLGTFTTGHCSSSGELGLVVNAWNRKNRGPEAEDFPCGVWNRGGGGGGCLRAYDHASGEIRWSYDCPFECHIAPVIVPSPSGSQGWLCVAAVGSQGGHCPEEDDEMEDNAGNWPSGDAWEAAFIALDALTGELVWRTDIPVWRHYEARGSGSRDIFLPDCFGSPTGTADGKVFGLHWSGIAYCLESATGRIISETDVEGSSQSAVVITPGWVFLTTCWAIHAVRDEALEEAWLAEARARGDPRADPRLWELGEQETTPQDRELIDSLLRVGPNATNIVKNVWKPCPLPNKTFSEETWKARNQRLVLKRRNEIRAMSGLPPEEEPPPAPKAKAGAEPEAEPEAAAPAAGQGQGGDDEGPVWRVVGGGKAGGVVVRRGESLRSAELGRLGTGSKVRETELSGERLHYEKISGDGPDFGWVSLKLKGQDLVVRD